MKKCCEICNKYSLNQEYLTENWNRYHTIKLQDRSTDAFWMHLRMHATNAFFSIGIYTIFWCSSDFYWFLVHRKETRTGKRSCLRQKGLRGLERKIQVIYVRRIYRILVRRLWILILRISYMFSCSFLMVKSLMYLYK